jgi:hypothetical protein
MKTNFTLWKFALPFLSPFLFSQITYESSDFTEIGETYQVVNMANPGSYDFTATGANYSWNFPNLQLAEPTNSGYEDPNNSAFKNIWCLYHFYLFDCDERFQNEFNMGMPMGDNFEIGEYSFSDVYQHSFKSNSEFQLKMLAGNVNLNGTNLPAILEFQNPDVLMRFPIQYNDTYTDNSSIDMDFTALGVDLVVNATGTRTNHVEGWGSLNVRNKIYAQTLKLKSTNVQFLNVYFEGGHNEIPVTTVTYSWFDKNYGIPVLTVNGTEMEGEFIPTGITYLFEESMGVQENLAIQSVIYPNPTTGKLNVILENNEFIQSIQVMDYSGKIVGKNLNISNLPNGNYLIKIQTNKRIISEKIIRK